MSSASTRRGVATADPDEWFHAKPAIIALFLALSAEENSFISEFRQRPTNGAILRVLTVASGMVPKLDTLNKCMKGPCNYERSGSVQLGLN